MTWRGTLRSISATARRMERDAQRRQRELERQARAYDKMQQLEQAAHDVEVYSTRMDLLKSVHKECGADWDWAAIYAQETSEPPVETREHESAALIRLQRFSPSLLDTLLRRVNSKLAALNDAVEVGKGRDNAEYDQALRAHELEKEGVEEAKKLAERILKGEESAYLEAIEETHPFSDINALGSSLSYKVVDKSTIEVTLHVNDEDSVPSEIKTLLQSGRISVKKMPKGAFYELYQDYICSCVIRVAREIFALLPIQMVLVHSMGNILNSTTGYMEEQPILSVAIPKKTLENLNLVTIDPSDSMGNFVHKMDFKKTSGFRIAQKIDPSTIQRAD